MFRLIALVLVALLVLLQVKLWAGDGSWRQVEALEAAVAQQRDENARLKLRNDALAAEVDDLKTGDDAIEERARSELGMIKPGEVFYRVVEPQHPARDEGRRP
ncbi:cell division protein FtsB [Coralloluteibacterium thermophilus]|uniref:Cell division protein FtsB n=1 Tax=Coralloluteibacterium thermophilum TaxID=2707049 RepID=A0ABV9NLM5_9GAMM